MSGGGGRASRQKGDRWARLFNCADCAADTLTLGEYYMVRGEVWRQACACPRKRIKRRELLCIGCLEKRIGRTLTHSDFIHCLLNNPSDPDISARMLDRLLADGGTP